MEVAMESHPTIDFIRETLVRWKQELESGTYDDVKDKDGRVTLGLPMPLSLKERVAVYELAGELGLFIQSTDLDPLVLKNFKKGDKLVTVSNKAFEVTAETKAKKATNPLGMPISPDVVDFFSEQTKIPIPIKSGDWQDLHYYLELTDKYYESKKKWSLFVSDVNKHGGWHKFRSHCTSVRDRLVKAIQTHPVYLQATGRSAQLLTAEEKKKQRAAKREQAQDVKADEPMPEQQRARSYPKNTIYATQYVGKDLLSVDIQAANFTLLQRRHPEIFDGAKTWPEFVAKFTDSKFVQSCKHMREVIFGKVGFGKYVPTWGMAFIHEVIAHLDDAKDLSVITVGHDEVVYEMVAVGDDDGAKAVQTQEAVKEILSRRFGGPNTFHVKAFRLEQLGTRPFFLKCYASASASLELKCCPEKNVMECIRFLDKTEPTERDMSYMDDGRVAVYKTKMSFV